MNNNKQPEQPETPPADIINRDNIDQEILHRLSELFILAAYYQNKLNKLYGLKNQRKPKVDLDDDAVKTQINFLRLNLKAADDSIARYLTIIKPQPSAGEEIQTQHDNIISILKDKAKAG